MTGLRERKKRSAEAMVQLALDRGLDDGRVEDIGDVLREWPPRTEKGCHSFE
jgi:hypothetical protein